MKFPIRMRLATAYCLVFCLMMAALETVAYFAVRAAIRSIVDRELETRLAGLDDHLTRHIAKIPWPELRDSLKAHAAFQPEFLYLRKAAGTLMFAGAPMESLPPLPYPRKPALATWGVAGHVLRVLSVRRTIQGSDYELALGTDLLLPSAVLSRLWLLMLVSLPVVLLIALGTGYWISGRALAPITGMIAATCSIDSTRLSERVAIPNTGDEIQQLALTVNGMLARIEDGFRQVRQFTANASHELRTPLSIIRATAEVALLGPADEPSYRESLRRILREAERNSTLLEELMQLARADAGADRARHAPVDLGRIVSQACADVAPLLESGGLDLRLQAAADCWIEGDAQHLHRLWLILLDNAVKFTPPGGTVSVAVGRNGHGTVVCRIADTGIGIAPEHLERIFERFYRVDKARSRARGGTGLGLAIAKQIADLHHAPVEVASQPGLGSEFRITFQALAGQAAEPDAAVCAEIFR